MEFIRIRNFREDNDLTNKQMGEILGISGQCYSRYERGLRNMPIEILIKIADYFNTSVDYLVGITDTRYPHKRARKTVFSKSDFAQKRKRCQ